jgi:hypothetical protein
MWIYNRKFTMGSGAFITQFRGIKFMVEMPSGRVLTKFHSTEEAYIKLNPSLFTWYEDKREEGSKEEQPQIEDKQENLFLSIVGDEELEVAKPKKSKKKGGS